MALPVKWRKVEREVMQSLGLKPSALSGGGWLEKEDGESDRVLAQLKSTAGKSISVTHIDLRDLIRHSRVAHKLPVFVLYFVGDEPYVMVRAGDLQKAARYLKYPAEKEIKDAKGSSRGKERNTNTKTPVQIRRANSKEIWRNNVSVSDRRGVSTVRAPSSNRSR